jgi:4-aminobutyrate aminotransferase-like enzyme
MVEKPRGSPARRSAPGAHDPAPGPRSVALVEVLAETECPSLTARRERRRERSGAAQDPIVWSRARGANVVDADGNVLVDLTAGFGAAAVGHGHPRVVEAVREQAGALVHALGDVHPSDAKIELLERLAAMAPWDDTRVILGAHGSDAIEAALKTAMMKTRRPGVLAFEGSYHGLAHAPLAISGYAERFRAPFREQLNPHVVFAPYPDRERVSLADAIAAVSRALAAGPIGCIVVEPILGRGGVVVPPDGFLSALSELARGAGALLVVDEIMTGLGRTGARFAFERDGVVPDLLCLGKALGGGMPVSACLGPHAVFEAWGDPDRESIHTATFFGHPIACASAIAALDVLEDEKLAERADVVGRGLTKTLSDRLAGNVHVESVRGRGLLIGLVLRGEARALSVAAGLLARGYITLAAGARADVLSLTPPLTIHESQLAGFVDALEAVLGAERGP